MSYGGPPGCGPAHRGSRAAGKGLLRNHEMRSYRPHTSSETKTVTINPGYGDTMAELAGPGPDELQGVVSGWPLALCMASTLCQEKPHDPQDPDRSGAQPALSDTERYHTTAAASLPRQTKWGHREPVLHTWPPRMAPERSTPPHTRACYMLIIKICPSKQERKKTQKRGFQGTPSAHTAISGGQGGVQV